MVSVDELVDRAYAEGGPKHGIRRRRDAIETLAGGYRYLHIRAGREGSSDYACTAEQTIEGLTFELSRRPAKAWDPALAQGLTGSARRELLVHHRGRAMAKLLDELAGCGLVAWGGERDNNGLWWRLRIRLLDPDEPTPTLEPWMRTAHLPASHDGTGHQAPGAVLDLRTLQDAARAAGASRMLAPAEADRLRGSLRRFDRHVDHRPRGVAGDPMAVLLGQLEVLRGPSALVRALAGFHELSRQMERAARTHPGDPSSLNSAALSNQQRQQQQQQTVPQQQSVAFPRGAQASWEIPDARTPPSVVAPPAKSHDSEETEDRPPALDVGGLLERVAAGERRLEALSAPRRAQLVQSLHRARCWPAGDLVPMGLLGEACEALTRHRPWLRADQLDRLRRGERRYALYAAHRPDGAPAAAAAALIALLEQPPPGVRAPLPWAIARLDGLTKQMRRTARRATETQRLAGARKRARRRRDTHQPDPSRRLSFRAARRGLLEATVNQLAGELAHTGPPTSAATAPAFAGGDLAAHLEILTAHLAHQGTAITTEQLRLRVRDQLLLTQAPGHLITWLQGTSGRSAPSALVDTIRSAVC
jgi:hypothetical protein